MHETKQAEFEATRIPTLPLINWIYIQQYSIRVLLSAFEVENLQALKKKVFGWWNALLFSNILVNVPIKKNILVNVTKPSVLYSVHKLIIVSRNLITIAFKKNNYGIYNYHIRPNHHPLGWYYTGIIHLRLAVNFITLL